MTAIVFVRSITFTYSPPHRHAATELRWMEERRWIGVISAPCGLLWCKYCASEWRRSRGDSDLRAERWRPGGKSTIPWGWWGGGAMPASLCAPATPCDMTGRVTLRAPGPLPPLWPVSAQRPVAPRRKPRGDSTTGVVMGFIYHVYIYTCRIFFKLYIYIYINIYLSFFKYIYINKRYFIYI